MHNQKHKRYLDQLVVSEGWIYVTCSDSTVWAMDVKAHLRNWNNRPWIELPKIPDPALENIAYADDGELY